MFRKSEYIENFILTFKKYLNNFSILIVFLLFLSGFLGPNLWEIVPVEFNFSKFQRNLSKEIKNFEKLDKFETTRNYLSKDQINDKKIVLSWSNTIHKKVENNKPLPRMYFSRIPNNFDKYGNYNIGISEQLIFPEIDYDQVEQRRGFNITIVTTAKTQKEGYYLLKECGIPFAKQ